MPRPFKKKYALALILVLFFMPYSTAHAKISQEERIATYKQLEIFSNVLSILQENYVEQIDSKEVLNGAIKGLLYSLDPHSAYLDPEGFRELQEETRGNFSGIGIEVTVKENELTIVTPIIDSPAERAGLKSHDIILEIDGIKTKDMGPDEAINKLRGPAGSEVTISIHREGWDELREITLVREVIPLQSVKAAFLSRGIAYSRIARFQSHTATDYKKELRKLAESYSIDGIILDLRNNPGGLLPQAIDIADIFLSEGKIVYTKGRKEEQNNTYFAHNNRDTITCPLVVLVNEGSASASEIVAGAIKAHNRGIIVGTRTFGKGTVQTIIPLPEGAGLKVTTAAYFTPDDRSIQARGIIPDVEIPFQATAMDGEKTIKEKIIKEKDLENHLSQPPLQHKKDSGDVADQELEDMLNNDNQLKTAYNIVKSLYLYSKYNE